MRLDAAGQNLELDVPITVHGSDSGDLWVSLIVADNYVTTNGHLDTWSGGTTLQSCALVNN